MAKAFTGKDGKLEVDGVNAGKVVDWQFEGQNEVLESTTLNDSFRSYISGIIGFSGSATLLYYEDGGVNSASSLINKARNGTQVVLILRLVDGATNKDIKFNALISSFSIGVSVGDIVRANFTFNVTGPLTEVTI